jgi:peptidylprolyl isomerase
MAEVYGRSLHRVRRVAFDADRVENGLGRPPQNLIAWAEEVIMTRAKSGDTVRVHYTGRLQDGTIFDSSVGSKPLEFTIGAGQVIAGFDDAVAGMEPGDSRSTEIPPEQAYGPQHDELIVVVPRDQLPEDLNPRLGLHLAVKKDDGGQFGVRVTDVTPTTVTLDANHELAGKSLVFDIELVEVV